MATTQKSAGSRPYNALLVLVFAVAAVAAGWLMRVETGIKGIPVDFVEQVQARVYANGMPMRTRYTGIDAVDQGMLFLVAAFAAGPLAWDEGVRLHQLHFLVQFFAVIAVWNVEACRARNARRLISYTALFVLFYQTIAGAAIIPLYYLSWALSSRSDAYYAGGRAVSLPYARGILLSVGLGYLLPTLAMYLPFLDDSTAQFLIFLWQPSPAFVNMLLFVSSLVFPAASSPSTSTSSSKSPASPPPDVKHLKRVYAAAAVVCAANHLATLYVSATSSNPQLGLAYVFLPDRALWTNSTTAGLHYIFQVDEWGCFLPTLLWAWVAVWDVHRILLPAGAAVQLARWALYIVGLTLVLGPGAMLAIVWSWREDRLLLIESGARGSLQIGEEKPKAA
ncbi:hypothetical protein F5Y14DRAFT_398942 [Nemania sp. NC0429]|nr:hypothetical protein F5Y14DRAFT_398942 [Nemania sp. NC0429]